jgi:hypothetical protein
MGQGIWVLGVLDRLFYRKFCHACATNMEKYVFISFFVDIIVINE